MFYHVQFSKGGTGKVRSWNDKVIDTTDNLAKFMGRPVTALMAYLTEVQATWTVYAERTIDGQSE
jgi:hypothetical protein